MVGNSITTPILKAVSHSQRVANLDLPSDVPDYLLSKKDEIGFLSTALQNITNSLREVLNEINNSSQQLTVASEELTASSQQSASAAADVTQAVEEIAKSASEQARNTEDGTAKAVALGQSIDTDAQLMHNLNSALNKVTEIVNEGLLVI